MKRIRYATLIGLLFLLEPGFVLSQIESTIAGGLWTEPTTWKDNTVPGPNDNVVIKGPVILKALTYAGDIKIQAGGSIRPEIISSNQLYKLYVKRNITNEGAINGPNLRIFPGGNVYNSGSWNSERIVFEDTLTHYFTSYPGSPIKAYAVRADSATLRSSGPVNFEQTVVYADSFYLGNNNPVMPNDTLYLNNNTQLYINRFIGNGNAIVFKGNSRLRKGLAGKPSVYENVHLMGEVLINDDITFVGDILMTGTMRPYTPTTSPTVEVAGNFTNNGTVALGPNGYGFKFEVSGNFTNNGPFTAFSFRFQSSGVHHLSTDLNYEFSPKYFYATDSTVQSQSALRFDQTEVRIRRLELQPGHTLFLNQNSRLFVDELIGNGNTIQLNGNSQLRKAATSGHNSTYRNVNFKGEVNIGDDGLVVMGNTRLEGVMKPGIPTFSPTIKIYGNLENRGQILPGVNGYRVKFLIEGDILNYGVLQAQQLAISGKGPYTLVTDSTGRFNVTYFQGDSATVRSGSDLRFEQTSIQIDSLVMKPGHALYLQKQSIMQVNYLVGQNTKIFMMDQSYLQDGNRPGNPEYTSVRLYDNVIIGSSIDFRGPVELYGTMQPRFPTSSPTLTFWGPFSNLGRIQPGPNGYKFKVIAHNHITSKGDWQSFSLTWIGRGPFVLFTDTSYVFSAGYLNADTTTIVSGSPLRFDKVEASIDTLKLKPGHPLMWKQGILRINELQANGNAVILSNGTWLAGKVAGPIVGTIRDAVLKGYIGIGNIDIQFAGNTFLDGTMVPHFPTSSPTVFLLDFFQNRGNIKLGVNGYGFKFQVLGDFENAGTITASQLAFVGQADQHVGIQDSAATLKNVMMKAQVNGSSYQWLKDGVPLNDDNHISGTKTSSLNFKTLSLADAGTYQCQVDSAGVVRLSRKVIVNQQVTSVRPPEIANPHGDNGNNPNAPQRGVRPTQFALGQNYPNPFNPTTTIPYEVPVPTRVQVQVFDANGRLIRTLVDGVRQPGRYRITFSAPNLPSGVYFYRLQANPMAGKTGARFQKVQKMILLK